MPFYASLCVYLQFENYAQPVEGQQKAPKPRVSGH